MNFELGTLNSRRPRPGFTRSGFTLAELMIVIAIIAIISGLGASAYSGAVQMSRENRTRSVIEKIDQLIMERYEEYRTRSVPMKTPNVNFFPSVYPTGASRSNALMRLLILRALMRMELPDRRTDIINISASPPTLEGPGISTTLGPLAGNLSNFINQYNTASPGSSTYQFVKPAALQKSYARTAVRMLGGNPNNPASWSVLTSGGPSGLGWTPQYEGAECLYLILSTMREGEKSALDLFGSDEIGDVDGDGMLEILDGWGTPIEFLRWAPGYVGEVAALQGSTIQTLNPLNAPDPFDPVRSDPRWVIPTGSPFALNTAPYSCYALFPLIISAGPDKVFDIQLQAGDGSFRYAAPAAVSGQFTLPNDPYHNFVASGYQQLGTPTDTVQLMRPEVSNGDGQLNTPDNITNHAKQAQ